MYNPISLQFLLNLKESPNFAPKKCIAPLVERRAQISLAVANVEKRGARDPAGWSTASVMCAAQEISFPLGPCFYFGLFIKRYHFFQIFFLRIHMTMKTWSFFTGLRLSLYSVSLSTFFLLPMTGVMYQLSLYLQGYELVRGFYQLFYPPGATIQI